MCDKRNDPLCKADDDICTSKCRSSDVTAMETREERQEWDQSDKRNSKKEPNLIIS